MISVPTGEGKAVTYSNDNPSSMISHILRSGAEIVSRYVSPHLVPQTLRAEVIFDGFSHYQPETRTIFIRENASAKVVAHEDTHDVEWSSEKMRKRVAGFLIKRGIGGKVMKTSEYFDDPRYSDNDLIYFDRWKELGGDDYTGRLYPDGSTEILSTGIPRLHDDPVRFYRTDPEFFEFLVNTLRGW